MANSTNISEPWPMLRLVWIERQAHRSGTINRREIQSALGLSAAQSSSDLQALQELHPGCLSYDLRSKTYRWSGRKPKLKLPTFIKTIEFR